MFIPPPFPQPTNPHGHGSTTVWGGVVVAEDVHLVPKPRDGVKARVCARRQKTVRRVAGEDGGGGWLALVPTMRPFSLRNGLGSAPARGHRGQQRGSCSARTRSAQRDKTVGCDKLPARPFGSAPKGQMWSHSHTPHGGRRRWNMQAWT